jgi:hypothetical protein
MFKLNLNHDNPVDSPPSTELEVKDEEPIQNQGNLTPFTKL